MCTGWWAGLGVHFIQPVVTRDFGLPYQIGNALISAIPDAFIGAGICYLLRAVFVYACEDCAMNLPEFNDIQVQENKTDGLQSSDHT